MTIQDYVKLLAILFIWIRDETGTAKRIGAGDLLTKWTCCICRICSLSRSGSKCACNAGNGQYAAGDRLVLISVFLRFPGRESRWRCCCLNIYVELTLMICLANFNNRLTEAMIVDLDVI